MVLEYKCGLINLFMRENGLMIEHLKGKLIHADGGIYEGEWVNDKTNGVGTYLQFNGAKNFR